MSEKGTKKSKKHRKSELSEGDAQGYVPSPVPDTSGKDVLKKRKRSDDGDTVNDTSGADATQPKHRKSNKQQRPEGNEVPEGSATSTPAADPITQPKAVKIKEQKHTEGGTLGDEPVAPPTDADTESKPKKRKKQKQTEATAPPVADTSTQPKSMKSKKQKQTEGAETQEVFTTGVDATQPKPQKSKKRKQTQDDQVLDESANPGANANTQPKSKRSKKQNDGHKDDAKPYLSSYPDPSNNESLTEQSRKALTYAYERFQAFQSWKFNKARQNWLLRNFWSEEAIPQDYIAIVIKYFADLKGASREKLIETCNSKISAASGTPKADEITSQPGRSRAESLLQALSSEST